MFARDKYEKLAEKWNALGRHNLYLLDNVDLLVLKLWMQSEGASIDAPSKSLIAFRDKALNAKPANWYDEMLWVRDLCFDCRMQFKRENLMFCTHCNSRYCYACRASGQRAANGNLQCDCGGELVG